MWDRDRFGTAVAEADFVAGEPAVAVVDQFDVRSAADMVLQIARLPMPNPLAVRVDLERRSTEQQAAEVHHLIAVEDQPNACVLAGHAIQDLRVRDREGPRPQYAAQPMRP